MGTVEMRAWLQKITPIPPMSSRVSGWSP